MSEQTFTFTYAASDSECDGTPFQIEQKDWGDVGVVTREHIAAYLMKVLYDIGDYPVECGITYTGGGLPCYTTEVYVYPTIKDLEYTFHVSHGTPTIGIYADVILSESVSFDIDKELDTKYPIHEVLSIKWIGKVFDEDGNILHSPPDFTINAEDGTVTLPYMVYGAAELKYRTIRHTYKVTVPMREGAVENAYQSFAFCVSKCGVEYEELEPMTLDGEVECPMKGSDVTISGPDDDEPRSPQSGLHTKLDYCSREEI